MKSLKPACESKKILFACILLLLILVPFGFWKAFVVAQIHDIAVTNVAVPGSCNVGEIVSINVTVENHGDFTEDFNLELYTRNMTVTIDQRWITALTPNTSRILSVGWNTAGLQPDYYLIEAFVNVSLDSNWGDNNLRNGTSVNALPAGAHDLAVTGIGMNPSSCTVGDVVAVWVTVDNHGDFIENFDLMLFHNFSQIETKSVAGLAPGASTNVSFTWKTNGLQSGNYRIGAQAQGGFVDNTESDNVLTRMIAVNAQAGLSPAGIPWEIIIPATVAAAVIAAVLIYLKKRPKKAKKPEKPKPGELRVSVDPKEIVADGKSTSKITVELVDVSGSPLPCLEDTPVSLHSTGGTLPVSVTVLKNDCVTSTTLTSSKTVGIVTVTARYGDSREAKAQVTFTEKKRYCMHCGSTVPSAAKVCPKCGRTPPAGLDTKTCENCGSVIPVVAKFCGECGASQPK